MEEHSKKKKTTKQQSKFALWYKWPLIVLIISFVLSMAFGILSEIALSNASVIISIVVILVFLIISIITDMIGVAVTAADIKYFRAMASRKVRGAKEAISLKKHADRVASIFADILGDICGILSGAAGATVTAAFIKDSMSTFLTIVIASLVSAIIAALIISGKALMKRYSMIHSEPIILFVGKFMSIFHIDRKSKKSKKRKGNELEIQIKEEDNFKENYNEEKDSKIKDEENVENFESNDFKN